MENEARFDLNKALQDWEAQLATQPGITAENIRELNTHLRESIDAFKNGGCSDYAAFRLARQKLGSVQKLGAEFAKENLVRVWRDRAFWITTVLLFMMLLNTIGHTLLEKLAPLRIAHGLARFPGVIVSLLVFVVMVTGFAEVIFRRLHWIFARRWRFAVTGVIAIAGTDLILTMSPDFVRQNLWVADTVAFPFLAFAVFILPREFAMVSATTRSAWRRNSITLWRDRLFWVVFGVIAFQIWASLLWIVGQAIAREKVWIQATLLSVWFLILLAVALMLASARLTVLERWLCTRWRVAFIGGALVVLWAGLLLRPLPPHENWSQIILGLALLMAMMLVATPSRARRQQENAL